MRARVCVRTVDDQQRGRKRERERERERACYWRAWWLLVPGQRQLDDSTDWRYRSRTESITRRMLSLPLKEKPIVANRIDGTRFSLSLSLSLFFILPFLTSSPSVREFSFIRITVLGRDWIFTALLYRPSLFRAVPSFFFSMIILSIMVWFGFFFCPFIISSYLPLSVFRMSHRTLELLFPIALSFMPKKKIKKVLLVAFVLGDRCFFSESFHFDRWLNSALNSGLLPSYSIEVESLNRCAVRPSQ